MQKSKINIKTLIKKYYINVITLIIGVSFMALGGAMLVSAGYGSDALMVYNQGLATALKIDIGTAIIISNCLAFVVMLIVNKKDIGLGTLMIAFLLGPLVNLVLYLGFLPEANTIFESIIIIAFAFIFGTFGISLYMYSSIGLSPFEGILIAIKEKKKWRFAYIKIVNDAIFFLIGWLLGGVFGIASIITVIVYGPLIDMFTKIFTKLNIIKKEEKLPEIPSETLK